MLISEKKSRIRKEIPKAFPIDKPEKEGYTG